MIEVNTYICKIIIKMVIYEQHCGCFEDNHLKCFFFKDGDDILNQVSRW